MSEKKKIKPIQLAPKTVRPKPIKAEEKAVDREIKLNNSWLLEDKSDITQDEYQEKMDCPKCGFKQSKKDYCEKCGISIYAYAEELQKKIMDEAGETAVEEEKFPEEEDIDESLIENITDKIKSLFGLETKEELKMAEQAGLLKKPKRQKKARKEKKEPEKEKKSESVETEENEPLQTQITFDKETTPENKKSKSPHFLKSVIHNIKKTFKEDETDEKIPPEVNKDDPPKASDLTEAETEKKFEYEIMEEKPTLFKRLFHKNKTSDTEETTVIKEKSPQKDTKPTEDKTVEKSLKIKSKPKKKIKKAKRKKKQESLIEPRNEQEEMAQFVAHNLSYFLSQFYNFQILDVNDQRVNEFEISWNWPTFLCPPMWFFYRKMYLYALLSLFTLVIPLISNSLWAIAANYLYFLHVNKKLTTIKVNLPPEASLASKIKSIGGVNKWFAFALSSFVMGSLIIWIILKYNA